MSRPEASPASAVACFGDVEQVADYFNQCAGAVVAPLKGGERHGVLEHPRGGRVTLGVVRVEQIGGRGSGDDLRELPAKIHGVLHAEVEALPTGRVVNVCGVTGQQHAPGSVVRCLASGVGEARDHVGRYEPEV